MADYLALRCTRFRSSTRQTPELETMLRWNWQLEFGEELGDEESQYDSGAGSDLRWAHDAA